MEKGVKEFARLFAQQNTDIFREATKRVSNSIVRISPVAEGEFVADWDVGVNQWPSDTAQPPDRGRKKTRERLNAVISRLEYGQAAFFENDDPVAVRLEFGYSKKAPQGVVRLTARQWRRFVKGAGTAAQRRVAKRIVDG